MLSRLALLMVMTYGASSLPNGVQFQYGASPDPGYVDDEVTYSGKMYWVDYVNGNDTNDGQSKVAAGAGHGPWKTWARVNKACAPIGVGGYSEAPRHSAFFFPRSGADQTGNVFTTGKDITGYFCNYTFGVWGTGTRPKITYGTGMSGQDNTTSIIGGTGFTSTGLMHGLSVRNLHLVGDAIANPATTIFGIYQFWADTITVWNCEIEQCGASGVSLGLATTIDNNNGQGGVVLFNNTIHDCCISTTPGTNGAGMGGGGNEGGTNGPAGNMFVMYNTVYNCGGIGAGTSHQGYFFGTGSNSLFLGNDFYVTGNYGNFALVIHGYCSGTTVTRNRFRGTNNGFSLSCGYNGPVERFDQFDVNQNITENCGQYGSQGYGFTLQAVTNSKVWGNLFNNNKIADILCGLGQAEDYVLDTLEIVHNTMYRTTGATGSGQALAIAGALGPIHWANNIVVQAASTGNSQFPVSKAVEMSDANFTSGGNCYFTSVAGIKTHFWDGTTYTLAAFQAAFPTQEVGSIYADPQFVNPGALDFRIPGSSPAASIGAALGYTNGLDARRFSLTAPSAGCYPALA